MADPAAGGQHHLDAGGGRDVVYCHQCGHEWYRDEYGLPCPRCEGEATEIISPENDPRPTPPPRIPPEEIRGLQDHNPWEHDDSDPGEDDIEQFMGQTPGHATVFTRTFTSPGFQRGGRGRNTDDPANIMNDFQRMVSGMLGPGLQQGPAGRSGLDNLYPTPQQNPDFWPQPQTRVSTFGSGNIRGARWTFTTGTRNMPGQQGGSNGGAGTGPGDNDLANILSSLFGPPGPASQAYHNHDRRDGGPQLPPGLAGLFASMLNPANAVSGDAVYSQEALDRIISTLMEQHPTSNAPGPAPPNAIASLQKKKVDEKMLGAEGEAECSVCMDNVVLGEEVVVLPCTHWFHEACATAWLQEHNTCPICRKGIDEGNQTAPAQGDSQTQGQGQNTSQQRHSYSTSNGPSSHPRRPSLVERLSRNHDRLSSIRNAAGLGDSTSSSATTSAGSAAPELEERTRRRYQVVGDAGRPLGEDGTPPQMPGSWDPTPQVSRSTGTFGSQSSSSDRPPNRLGDGSPSSNTGVRGWFQRLGSNGGGSNSGSAGT